MCDNSQPTPGSSAAPAQPTRRVLFLAHRMPYPPDRGDRIRSYHLIRTLVKHFDVAVACTNMEPVIAEHRRQLAQLVSRLAVEQIRPTQTRIKGLAACLSGRAITPSSFFHKRLARQVLAWHDQQPFDAVLTFCTGMIRYWQLLVRRNAARPRHVLDLVDVDSAKWAGYAADASLPMKWVYAAETKRLRRIEAGERDPVDAITVVSESERQTYRTTVGDHPHLHVVGNGVDTDYFQPLPDAASKTIVFTGVMDYKPNADAVVWFAERVMSELLERVPDAQFRIVGRDPTQRVRNLGRLPGVEVTGSVADVRDHLQDAAVAVAPLRIGRGVQNKVLEAMASRRAVICSPQAAEGIDADPGEHLLVADQPGQWVEHLQQLLTDSGLRRRIADAARRQVELKYNWGAQLRPMVALLTPDAS